MWALLLIYSTYAGKPDCSELDLDELKPILSDGEVPVGTLTAEKLVVSGRNSSDEPGILRQ